MDETALRRTENDSPAVLPSRAWRRAALGVPLLAVVACVFFALCIPVSDGRTDRMSTECRWLPLSWDYWLFGYGGLAAAVGAVALHIGLRRYARARGWLHPTWQRGLADSFAVLGWLAVLLTAVAAVLTTSEQSDYAAHHDEPVCEGMAFPGAVPGAAPGR
jgi:hypothetical protein